MAMRANDNDTYRGAIRFSEDNEYYRQRAVSELDLAEKATHAIAAKIHSELALIYAAKSASLDMGEESRWQGFMLNGCR